MAVRPPRSCKNESAAVAGASTKKSASKTMPNLLNASSPKCWLISVSDGSTSLRINDTSQLFQSSSAPTASSTIVVAAMKRARFGVREVRRRRMSSGFKRSASLLCINPPQVSRNLTAAGREENIFNRQLSFIERDDACVPADQLTMQGRERRTFAHKRAINRERACFDLAHRFARLQ